VLDVAGGPAPPQDHLDDARRQLRRLVTAGTRPPARAERQMGALATPRVEPAGVGEHRGVAVGRGDVQAYGCAGLQGVAAQLGRILDGLDALVRARA
jgi:hypothetical protein